ncbi:BRO-N domain-containing protein [Antarctobacter jejuensis]|uniref:BRO-N domain-containing protein n=1 Tax=Antarctobacter jejuensis TaxID=1439938 RepID=UPI003FD26279
MRVVEKDDQPWFVAGDLLRVFDYSRPDNMLRSLDARDKMVTPQSLRGMGLHPHAKLISESGLYMIIMRAQWVHPIAREFQDWVTRVVLPATRKDGSNILGEEKVATGEEILSSAFPNPLTEEP